MSFLRHYIPPLYIFFFLNTSANYNFTYLIIRVCHVITIIIIITTTVHESHPSVHIIVSNNNYNDDINLFSRTTRSRYLLVVGRAYGCEGRPSLSWAVSVYLPSCTLSANSPVSQTSSTPPLTTTKEQHV